MSKLHTTVKDLEISSFTFSQLQIGDVFYWDFPGDCFLKTDLGICFNLNSLKSVRVNVDHHCYKVKLAKLIIER